MNISLKKNPDNSEYAPATAKLLLSHEDPVVGSMVSLITFSYRNALIWRK